MVLPAGSATDRGGHRDLERFHAQTRMARCRHEGVARKPSANVALHTWMTSGLGLTFTEQMKRVTKHMPPDNALTVAPLLSPPSREFDRAPCAPPFLSAAVAQLGSLERV